MGKLIAWEIGVMVLVAFVYTVALFFGLKPEIGTAITGAVILIVLVFVVLRLANSKAFTTISLAFSMVCFTIVFTVPIPVVKITSFFIALLALFASLTNSTEFSRLKDWHIYSSLLIEATIIVVFLKYAPVFIAR